TPLLMKLTCAVNIPVSVVVNFAESWNVIFTDGETWYAPRLLGLVVSGVAVILSGETDMFSVTTRDPSEQFAVRVALPAVVGPEGRPSGGLDGLDPGPQVDMVLSSVCPVRFAEILFCAIPAWDQIKIAKVTPRI